MDTLESFTNATYCPVEDDMSVSNQIDKFLESNPSFSRIEQ